jgi:preprotein translocase subunit YajC
MSHLIEAISASLLLAADDGQGGSGGLLYFMPWILGMGLLFYLFFVLPERRERQRKEQLRKELKKNDRVVTIGGMLGTVASVSPDGNEVTLKIDEATGAKMRVLRSAIHEVLKDKDDAKKDDKRDDPKKDESKKDEKTG